MKHTRLFSLIIATVLVSSVILSSAFLLSACNKDELTINDIFKEYTSDAEFSGYKQEFALDVGWQIYTTSTTNSSQSASLNSDVGYIKSLNAFVVSKDGKLSIVKCGDNKVYVKGGMKGMLFSDEIGITALRVKGNLIVCKFSNGDVGAFDINGRTAISRLKIGGASASANIDNIIKILDDNLIAVHATYDNTGITGYTSIYRPTYDTNLDDRGMLVCRVANNDNALSYVDGFDGKYVSVVGNKVGDCVYRIPDSTNSPQNMTASANATLVNDGKENYDDEITYIGNGKFFMHEMWTVSSSDDYDYTDGDKKWKLARYIYTPDNDSLSEYTANSDKVFMNMTNNYYGSAKNGIDTNSYLKDGFTYVSYGLFIEKKVGFYDQYILDSNMNVVMSLTGNFGVTIKDQTKDKVGVYDLVMTKVDGYYYVPIQPSEINVYDGKGNLVGHNDRGTVLQQELSNNMIVAGIVDPEDDDEVLYGAFNVYGEEVIDFKYSSLSAFRGAYTIFERVDNSKKIMGIIGTDGVEITKMSDNSEPLADIAVSSNNKPIYKIGCYMFVEKHQEADGSTKNYYGIKNFNANVDKNVVIPAIFGSGSVLYAPNSSPSDVFVFEKITNGSNVSYTVYRLI